MTSFLLTLNLVASLAMTSDAKFNYLYDHLSTDEQTIINANNVTTDDELDAFVISKNAKKTSDSGGEHSDSITNISEFLSNNYPDYYWYKDDGNTTRSVTNAVPINVGGPDFPKSEILTAIENTGVPSSYGGCGPIAIMGIMDYFSRYLGYTEYINDPTSPSDRIALAEDVLRKSKTFELGFQDKSTLMFPWDYESAFDGLTADYGLSGIVNSTHQWKLFSGSQTDYWNKVVENIDKGLPVTLMTGLWSGSGNFAEHYTNIFGYETWKGYDSSTNERIEKNYIIVRLNWKGWNDEYYCDASILNDGMIGLITYDINYGNSYNIYASDFAEEFVNSNGGGQYFFYDKETPVSTANGRMIYTHRKRCSYIENQYLVLSPNRANAGEAYLDIQLPHSASKVSFTASLWSSLEGINNETFKIQYYSNGWHDHVSFDLSTFSKLKQYPNEYTVLMPKNITRFRFIANHSNPSGDRNKGRIILDNLNFEYYL